MGLADDRVAFPVAGAPFVIDDGRSFADVRSTGDAAASGGAPGGLAAAGFAALAEAGMELAAVGAVLVNAPVEPGEADGDVAGESQATGDLLEAPVHAEHVADAVPEGWMELAGAGGGLSAALFGADVGCPVAVAGGVGIAAEFAVDGGSVALELGRDGVGRGSLSVQGVDLAALVAPQLVVGLCHGGFPQMIGHP